LRRRLLCRRLLRINEVTRREGEHETNGEPDKQPVHRASAPCMIDALKSALADSRQARSDLRFDSEASQYAGTVTRA
jgi:hypothetical protein